MTAIALAKMGVRYLSLYDFDMVGTENLATQLHKVSDVGKPKVETVGETVQLFSDETGVASEVTKVTKFTRFSDELVICCVDTIAARKEVYQAAYLSNGVKWFLDTRMSAMEYQHFLVNIDSNVDDSTYSETLAKLDDSNVPDVPCTEKATMFTAFMAAAHVGNVVKKIVTGDAVSHRLVQNIKTDFLFTIRL